MTSNFADAETSRVCFKCNPFLLKTRKKYILIVVVTKALIIWFCMKSSYLFPPAHIISPLPVLPSKIPSLYNVSLFHIPLTHQNDMLPFYIEITPDVWCFLNGLNLKESKIHKKCKCLIHWYGFDCGIPEAVWISSYLQQGRNVGVEIRRRKIPRRIVCSVLFLDEFSLLDILVHNSFSAVDVFIIAEEETGQPSLLLHAMKQGYLSEFQSKLMLLRTKNVSMTFENIEGWSSFMFNSLWTKAWEHIADLRPDDLFLFLHVSSIISKDVLLFLKLYDGFPEPFYFELRPLLYSFKRSISTNSSIIHKIMFFPPLGCSFQYFHFICNNNIIKLLTNSCISNKNEKIEFEKTFWTIKTWVIGSSSTPSGWQCNWCIKIHEINSILKRHKLFHNHNVLDHITGLNYSVNASVSEGRWLDGSYVDYKLLSKNVNYFVPECVRNEPDKYSFLINNIT